MSTFARRISAALGALVSGLLAYQVTKYKRSTRQRFNMPERPRPGTVEFSRLVSAMTGAALRPGNRVRITRNGVTLDGMVEAIVSAKATIDCSSYIYWPGEAADRFTDAFIERAGADELSVRRELTAYEAPNVVDTRPCGGEIGKAKDVLIPDDGHVRRLPSVKQGSAG